MNPDCAAGKHAACNGDGWDHEADEPTDCPCTCHAPTDVSERCASDNEDNHGFCDGLAVDGGHCDCPSCRHPERRR